MVKKEANVYYQALWIYLVAFLLVTISFFNSAEANFVKHPSFQQSPSEE